MRGYLLVMLMTVLQGCCCLALPLFNDGMPDKKHMEFTMEGGERMKLNLERTDCVKHNTPIIEMLDGFKIKLRDDMPDDTRFAVYRDVENHASVIMQPMNKTKDGKKMMKYSGIFRSGNQSYEFTMMEGGVGDHGNGAEPLPGVSMVTIEEERYLMTKSAHAPSGPFEENIFPLSADRNEETEESNAAARENAPAGSPLPAAALVNGGNYVQLLLVLDYSVWRNFMNLANNYENRAMELLLNYYAHVVNGIDMRYNSIQDRSYRFYIRLAYILIAKTRSLSPWTAGGDVSSGRYTYAYPALNKFEEWLIEMNDILPPHDQATLYTDNKLLGGFGNQILGLASYDSVCQTCRVGQCAASINSATSLYSSIQTGAHEMAHNLGSRHDSNSKYAPSCPSSDQYIMAVAPTLLTDKNFENPFTFSYCSRVQFRNYLISLSRQNKYCLSDNVDHFDREEFKRSIRFAPGQILSPDRQCELEIGRGSYYCGGGTRDERICREMRCWDPAQRKCTTERDRNRAELRAADGTTCGNQKWCYEGECQYNRNAPASSNTCIYGDYRGVVTRAPNTLTCTQMVEREPWRCYQDHYASECCESCPRVRQDKLVGCEFGDRTQDCNRVYSSPTTCYDVNARKDCCGSCAKIAKPNLVKGCEYGDKVSWCRNILRRNCYVDFDNCCETCTVRYRPTQEEGCEYGDKVGHCSSLHDRECYREDNSNNCCDSCKRRKFGPTGCEWGDRVPGCHVSECENPSRHEKCCRTCAGYISTTRRTTAVTPVTTPPSATCTDKASYCPSMPAGDCYLETYKNTCCQRCASVYTGKPGCEYGDILSSCPQISDRDCYHPDYMRRCCNTCGNRKTGPAGCEWGDQISTCRQSDCEDPGRRDLCCKTCRA